MAGLTKCDYLRAVSEYDRHIMLDLNTALGSHLTPQYGSSASLVHEAVILFKKHLLVSNQTQVYLLCTEWEVTEISEIGLRTHSLQTVFN